MKAKSRLLTLTGRDFNLYRDHSGKVVNLMEVRLEERESAEKREESWGTTCSADMSK